MFDYVQNGRVENKIVKNVMVVGICIYFSSYNTIINNSDSHCGISGIHAELSSLNNIIIANTVFNNAGNGIQVGKYALRHVKFTTT